MADFQNQNVLNDAHARSANSTGQAIAEAHLQLQKRQSDAAMEQHYFNQGLTALNQDWIPVEDKVRIANTLGKQFGIQGDITVEGLQPYRSLLQEMNKDRLEGKDLSRWTTTVEMFSKNPQFVDPTQRVKIIEAQRAIEEQKAAMASQGAIPGTSRPDQVNAAKARLEQNGDVLKSISTIPPDLQPNDPMIPALRRDLALVATDTQEQEQRAKLQRYFRMTPGAADKAMAGQLEVMGAIGTNPKALRTSQANNILQIPEEDRTPQQKQFLNAWAMTDADPHQADLMGQRTAEQDQKLAYFEQKDAQSKRVVFDHGLSIDTKTDEMAKDFTQKRNDLVTTVNKHPVKNDQEAAGYLQQATEQETNLAQTLDAYTQGAQPQLGYYKDLKQIADQQVATLLERKTNTPLAGQEVLSQRLKEAQAGSQAADAATRLLTTHSPLQIEVLKSSLVRQELQLKKAEAEKNPDAIAQAQKDYDETNQTIVWREQQREKDLGAVNSYRSMLMEREKLSEHKATGLENKMQAEARLRQASQLAANLHDGSKDQPPLPWTKALREAARIIPGVDMNALVKANEYWIKNEQGTTLQKAQIAMGAAVEAFSAKNGAPPDHMQFQALATNLLKTGKYPEITRAEITQGLENDPNAVKTKMEANIYTEKQSVQTSGQLANVNQSISELKEVRKILIKPDGTVDRLQLGAAALGLPFTKGRSAGQFVEKAVEIKLRAATGAAAPQQEVKHYTSMFGPSAFDSDEMIKYKIDSFENWMQTVADTTDPLGSLRERATELRSEGTVGLLTTPDYKELRNKFPQASAMDIVKFLQQKKAK
jgi:hypothetical protein